MDKRKKKFERKLIWEQRKDSIFIGIFGLLIVLILGLLPAINTNFGESSKTIGIVESLSGTPTDEVDILFLLVRLDDGKLVRVYISRSSFYQKGRKVRLNVKEPLVFGSNKYKFAGYVEQLLNKL